MAEIENSSSQISQIIGVIDEIAFQTNLLALNAGVEAARAGEAGRGFAVVAAEVRSLAQRSAEAAKEIKTLITASNTQVQSGVALVGETGNALVGIADQVSRIDTLVNSIAGSAQEQATGLGQLNVAVNQMDQMTQQNAAMVEETTAAAHAMRSSVSDLTGRIGAFQTSTAAGARRAA
jgi:methyl-accepting chemotaxis protein